MTPATEPIDAAKLRKQLYELRRETPSGVVVEKVPDLVEIAERLAPNGELRQQLEASLRLAIGDLDTDQQDIALVWFGLHEDTQHLDHEKRTEKAAEIPVVTPSTFKVHRGGKLIEEIGEQLIGRYESSMRPPVPPESVRSGQQQTSPTPVRRKPASGRLGFLNGIRARRPVGLAVLAVIVLVTLAYASSRIDNAFAPEAVDPSKEVPPPGTILNATDGSVVEKPNKAPGKQLGFIPAGSIFRVCNLSEVEGRCQFPVPSGSVGVNPGDVLLLGLKVEESGEGPLPYATFVAVRSWENNHSTGAKMVIGWPGDVRKGGGPILEKLTFVLPGSYGYLNLVYLPGSTELRGPGRETFIAHLPDGIMENGIALANLGPPVSCFKCFDDYKRYIFFKARVGAYDRRS